MQSVNAPEDLPPQGHHVVFLSLGETHAPSVQMATVLELLCEDFGKELRFFQQRFQTADAIKSWQSIVFGLPCVLLYEGHKLISKVEGANPPAVVAAVTDFAKRGAAAARGGEAEENLIKSAAAAGPVILFQEGPPKEPTTEEGAAAVVALAHLGLPFETKDVSSEPELKQALLTAAGQQPLPHLYVDGQFVGGFFGIRQLGKSAEGVQSVQKHLITDRDEKLKLLVNCRRVMLFMKGTPDAPYCRFSKQLLPILAAEEIDSFGYFNIFDDDEVREGLKVLYNWPTYPQIYVDGELLGGIDVIQQLLTRNGPGAVKAEVEAMLKKKEKEKC